MGGKYMEEDDDFWGLLKLNVCAQMCKATMELRYVSRTLRSQIAGKRSGEYVAGAR